MYNPKINYLIGIDFGHGETTASILRIKEDLIKNLNECISRELSSSEEVNEQAEDLVDKLSENAEREKSFSELISDIKMDSFGSIENLPIHGDEKTVKSAMARLYTIGDDDNPESEKSEWIASPSIQDIYNIKKREDPDNGKYFEFIAYFKGPLVRSKDIKEISPQQEIAFRKFIEAIMKEVNKTANEKGAYLDGEKCNCIIYAACPSTWTGEQKDEYQRFLKKSGVPCKEVLYESDAAYMSIRNTISEEGIKDNLLVVDLGSSSIDFTWYGSVVEGNTIRPQKPTRGGNPKFGASQVEEELVSYMVKEEKTADAAYTKLKNILPNYADSILQYAVRLEKEKWFKSIKTGNEYATLEEIEMKKICFGFTKQDVFGPDDDADGNPQAYDKAKIEVILKDFKDDLERELVKFRDKDDVGDIKYVMLTGSASKMYFVAPLAETVFGVSKKDRTLIDDTDAEFTVSKGAAKFGLYKYLSDPLGEEIKNLIDKTWGNYDWVNPVVRESINKVTKHVYKELLFGIIDQWSDKESNIVAKEDHNLNSELRIICNEVGPNSPWNYVSQAEPLFVAGCHSIHAVLREIFDYIEMANDKTRDAIDIKVSEALTDEINQKVGILFKKYISVYLNDKDYSDCVLPTFYKVTVDIDFQMQHDLLKKLIEFTFGEIAFPSANSLNKDRPSDGFSAKSTTRSELNPALKKAISDFVECIKPNYPEKEISEACMKSVDAKFKEIEAICEVEVYRLSDQQ